MSDIGLTPADADPQETREWLDALEAVIEQEGPGRAHYLIEKLIALGQRTGINIPYSANTEYVNTIPADKQPMACMSSRIPYGGWVTPKLNRWS